MSEIFLNRLDVIPGPETVDRIGVPEIVEPKLRKPQFSHDPFVVHVECLIVDVPAKLGGKNQIFLVVPLVTENGLPFLLLLPLLLKHIQHFLRHRDGADFAVFQRAEMKFLLTLCPVMLLVDQTLPTAGRIRDFHPIECALTGRTRNRRCRHTALPAPAISAGWTVTQLCVCIRILGHPPEKVLFCDQQSGIDVQGGEIRTVQQVIGTSTGDS